MKITKFNSVTPFLRRSTPFNKSDLYILIGGMIKVSLLETQIKQYDPITDSNYREPIWIEFKKD